LINKQIFATCSAIAVQNDEYYLFGERKDGQGWCFPGGKQEKETIEECALRELEEEFDIKRVKLKKIGRLISKAVVKGEIRIVNPMLFHTFFLEDEIKFNTNEYNQFKWIKLDEIDRYRIFAPTKSAIDKLIENL